MKKPRFSPAKFPALVERLGKTASLSLFGVDRVTLARWLSGESRLPRSALLLASIMAIGELPEPHPWHGWRFGWDGVLTPPGWGEGFTPGEITRLFIYRQEAARAAGLARRVAELEKQVAFYKNPAHHAARMGFMGGLVDVLNEPQPY